MGERIYIAGEDDHIRHTVKAFLESKGYEVIDFPVAISYSPHLRNVHVIR